MRKKSGPSTTVISLTEVRSKKRAEDRRKVERFFLHDVLQVFSVENAHFQDELVPLDILEVSERGFSFKVPYSQKNKIDTNQELKIRFYLSRDTYLSIAASVASSVPMMENGDRYIRLGCAVDTHFSSYVAYLQMVQFFKAFSQVASTDRKLAVGY